MFISRVQAKQTNGALSVLNSLGIKSKQRKNIITNEYRYDIGFVKGSFGSVTSINGVLCICIAPAKKEASEFEKQLIENLKEYFKTKLYRIKSPDIADIFTDELVKDLNKAHMANMNKFYDVRVFKAKNSDNYYVKLISLLYRPDNIFDSWESQPKSEPTGKDNVVFLRINTEASTYGQVLK